MSKFMDYIDRRNIIADKLRTKFPEFNDEAVEMMAAARIAKEDRRRLAVGRSRRAMPRG